MSCSDLKKDLPTETTAGPQIHGQGWIDSSSANFHGLAIQKAGWSMTSCTECHGPDFKGGSSNSSCLKCHSKPGGPENCTVCHGGLNPAPPKDLSGNTSESSPAVGAHQAHLIARNALATPVACNECHIVPASLSAAGHIDNTAGAEVMFLVTDRFAAGQSFSQSTRTCDNTYCHGNFRNGNKASVVWNDATGQAIACGSCHGDVSKSSIADKALPKTSLNGGTHPNDNKCYNCHTSVINSNYQLNASRHINGKIDFIN